MEAQIGANSYNVRVKETLVMSVHGGDLKKYIVDTYNKDPVPLYYHRRTVTDAEATPDEGNVEKILGHKIDQKGKYWFKVKWEGYPESDATWEPINHFFHRYSAPLIKYGRHNQLDLNIFWHLAPEPMTQ